MLVRQNLMCGIVNKGGANGNETSQVIEEVDYWLWQNSLCVYTVTIDHEPVGSGDGDTGTEGHSLGASEGINLIYYR